MNCLNNLPQCGAACCKTLSVICEWKTAIYLASKGAKVLKSEGDKYIALIPSRCKALTTENLCSLHGTEKKPVFCRDFGEKTITGGYFIPDKCIYKPEVKP